VARNEVHIMNREAIRAGMLADESALVRTLARMTDLDATARSKISAAAADLIGDVRGSGSIGIMESFLSEYGLSTEEGVALMCLAEAMLRVPDAPTVDELIKDKITPHDWGAHLGDSGSILVNATTWGLLLTGRVLDDDADGIAGVLHGLVRRMGEPLIRKATGEAMEEMGKQFVLGRDIAEAIKRGRELVAEGFTYSYDMLGEGARTDNDALRYHKAYSDAIKVVAKHATREDSRDNPEISVKLSALHPRYEMGQRETMLPVLTERVLELARAAKAARIGFNIDAEEADRLDLSLDVIETTLADGSLAGWDGFGVVVQTYGRRAAHILDWLYALAEKLDRRIMVRLVKGAYWDMEIKRAQVMGLRGYPVFTRKTHTDVSYIACARKVLDMTDRIYPQFATHNAHSAAAVLHMAGADLSCFEFQRLHGMGKALHDAIKMKAKTRCRIYAPVGAHRDLLAYLVRRLLENGANSSFVNQIVDLSVSPESIARDPIDIATASGFAPNAGIPAPPAIFAPRRNSQGWDLTDPVDLERIEAGRTPFAAPHRWSAAPITGDSGGGSDPREIHNPANPDEIVGEIREADAQQAHGAVGLARAAQPAWEATPVGERAKILKRVADLYEENTFEFLALATREAGKTLLDGIAEVREAVDFLRFYADEAVKAETGSVARGVIVCISPWNFPLAIFSGQIAAALATGNAVVAKPAEQTPLIAHKAVSLMREAGVPENVIQLLPGDGAAVGGPLSADPRVGGVCFTGSTEVAKIIDRQLARSAPGAMLIAETGGLNAMIVDSTALLEQAVRDIIRAAFQSAGQRCSALRVLYVQKDIEAELTEMLTGAMQELRMGDPWSISTDVGPVIDAEAHSRISEYCAAMARKDRVIEALTPPDAGLFIPPTAVSVEGIGEIEQEIFGPVLHVARFDGNDIDRVVQEVNAKGYGLTFGLHTRIDSRVQRILDRVHAGNIYVNRDQIGAVVGSQPFGGEGLSGTGPKAGGTHYAPRFRRKIVSTPIETVDGPVLDSEAVQSALASLDATSWAALPDRIQSLRAALRGSAADAASAAASLDAGPVDLPGPTGESNQFLLYPRGTVLCLGPDKHALLAQVVQALAAGNSVLAAAPNANEHLHALRQGTFPLTILDGVIEAGAVRDLHIDMVACCGAPEESAALRVACADRDGPIIPLITEPISPAAFCTERTICIDTTAAGGNATLLSSTEE
jgi:RHH-type transcriptional regulator, proline utilization regulon repressor / proline dehydrogenase / delta 1-pyrroline-5-carboxylate dehydrogenase